MTHNGGHTAPPEATGPPPNYGAPPLEPLKRRRSWGKIIGFGALGLIVLAVLVSALGGGSKDDDDTPQVVAVSSSVTAPAATEVPTTLPTIPPTTAAPAPEPVQITECYSGNLLDDVYMGAKGTAVNGDQKAKTFMITVRVLDPNGVQLDTVLAFANSVASGATAQWDSGTLAKMPAGTDPATLRCELAKVDIFPS